MTKQQAMPADSLTEQLALGRDYAGAFTPTSQKYREFLSEFRRTRGPIAALGAGHLCATFINLLGLADVIDCVIDDNPRKQGTFMPGSRLPIVGSQELVDRGIRLCLLSVNPEVEQRVREKNAEYASRGGEWMSMFTGISQQKGLRNT